MKIKSIFLSILLFSGFFAPTMLGMQRFTSRQIATPVATAAVVQMQRRIPYSSAQKTEKSFRIADFLRNNKKKIIAGIAGFWALNKAEDVALDSSGYIRNKNTLTVEKQEQLEKQAQEFLEKNEEFARFVARYRCSAEDEKRVDDGDTTVGYLKGLSLDRVQNACKLKNVIRQHELDHLDVAEKCLCRMKDNQYRVLSKKVIAAPTDQKISLQEVQQLVKVGKETGFADWALRPYQRENLIRSVDGKLVFVDTETLGFNLDGSQDLFKGIPEFMAVCDVLHGRRGIDSQRMTPEALAWLKEEYAALLSNSRTMPESERPILPCNQKHNGDCVVLDLDAKEPHNIVLALDHTSKRSSYDSKFSAINRIETI